MRDDSVSRLYAIAPEDKGCDTPRANAIYFELEHQTRARSDYIVAASNTRAEDGLDKSAARSIVNPSHRCRVRRFDLEFHRHDLVQEEPFRSKRQGEVVCTRQTVSCLKLRSPPTQHCYIGGGSEGLGFALACQLADKGAHVSIVSRSEAKLKNALEQLEVRTRVRV